ncbi:putative late blight resistance proteinR1B-12 [Sesamum alatum]|uniref:Late blight resistance proteinR1B-12 n=1 Tax=Sesamum alatum TaxID=300844 RepID=A0AAE1YC11_9LAMI|nr:putative late blight resistance proteinR1B-12 [Sesamum alatum]
MATAYAALVSLVQTTEQIQHHPRPPVSLDKEQVQSLQENVAFLQDFLELYSHRLSQEYEGGLVVRIAGAAHAAEDVTESRIADQILDDQSTTTSGEHISSIDDQLYQHLQKVIADMDLIRNEVIEIKERTGIVQDHHQLHGNSNPAGSLSSSALQVRKQAMVGCDDILNEIMDKLTGQQSGCPIIPIVGMGGIENKQKKEALREMGDEELGKMLYKSLSGKRYLIVMDDMWSIKAWYKVKLFFPHNNNESRIMITTRLSNLALQTSGSHGVRMNFLDEGTSWELFCKIVFGEVSNCPLELEEIGKTVARNCRGLPLSVIVIGGLLAKSEKTQSYWDYIAENLSSIVNLEDNEHCLRILYMSYQEVPIHLKPCFLYMGVFREDKEIHPLRLRRLWVAEGFLKPISGKRLEDAAKEYLNDLIDRNLIIVNSLESTGKIESLKMHDLLRDMCLREGKKEKFLCNLEPGQGITGQRRIVVHQSSSKDKYDLPEALHSARFPRSLTCDFQEALPLASFRLLRVLETGEVYSSRRVYGNPIEAIFKLVNSRYLSFYADVNLRSILPSSMDLLWNLHSLDIMLDRDQIIDAPPAIWKMHQLRHVFVRKVHLPDPTKDEFVLPNLQSMGSIVNFKCCEAMFRIQSDLLERLSFLRSLKELTLLGSHVQWEDITTKIGSLPRLQVLNLHGDSVIGPDWETVEGSFHCLIYLQISHNHDLEYCTAESSHFPRLKHLRLVHLPKLKKIPSSFGEIQTLEFIELYKCSDSAVISAKDIAEQQEEFGNQEFRVEASVEPNSKLKSLASRNFQVSSIR